MQFIIWTFSEKKEGMWFAGEHTKDGFLEMLGKTETGLEKADDFPGNDKRTCIDVSAGCND
ncbi:hypothetical protein [Paenibacillus sp. GYB003]|uniref:hypothetical protein n=1 Tax=Paenibacillus sp. GYB003 TaxID=2994392 RepID=UPI002F968B1E